MGALAIADLTPMGGEPRVLDLKISERLGFWRDLDIRKIIKRNDVELSRYGVLATVAKTSGEKGGRPTTEYYLNEAQALLICMKSDTEKAADVREQIIKVFMAYRRGEFVQAGLAPAPVDQTVVVLQRLEARLEALEAAGKRLVKLYAEPLEEAMALSHAVDLWYGSRRLAKPKFWHDFEVRGIVLATYRQMTIDQARGVITDKCGASRTPSRTAIGRFWQRLDRLRNDTPSLRMH
jgi:hypothetical protein